MSHPFQTASDVRKQPELTEQNYLDLSQIQPLTEAQADEYFNKPTLTELYHAELAKLPPEVQDIFRRYDAMKKLQIDNAYESGRREAHYRPGYGEMGG